MNADLVAVNGRIFTSNETQPWASAVAVSDGRFVHVGDNETTRSLIGPTTEVMDLKGALVLPGLVESHVHVMLGALLNVGLQLSMADSVEDVIEKVRAHAATRPGTTAIFGHGYNAMMFDENGPHRSLLDAALPDRPVLLMDHTLHGGWANSVALTRTGITAESADPLPSLYVRDSSGEPTGAIKGSGASVPVMVAIDALPADAISASLQEVLATLTSFGFTAALDCGNPVATELALAALGALDADGKLPLRISLTTMVNTPEMADIAIETQRHYATTYQGPHHWFDTLKIIGDSVIDNQTAAMLEPYDTTGERARLYFEPDTLQRLAREAANMGHGVIMHAIGDWTVREGLNTAEALRKAGHTDSRFILTHCELVHPDDVPRFAQLNVMAQTTSNWAVAFPGHRHHLGAWRDAVRRQPMHSWQESGAVLALGADWPATPGGLEFGLNPFVNFFTAMHRRLPTPLLAEWGAEPQALEPESEVLTLEETVRAYTINGARTMGREHEFGSIEVGKSADFIILDRDIFSIDPDLIWRTKVASTVFKGVVVYNAEHVDETVMKTSDHVPGIVSATSCPGCRVQ